MALTDLEKGGAKPDKCYPVGTDTCSTWMLNSISLAFRSPLSTIAGDLLPFPPPASPTLRHGGWGLGGWHKHIPIPLSP